VRTDRFGAFSDHQQASPVNFPWSLRQKGGMMVFMTFVRQARHLWASVAHSRPSRWTGSRAASDTVTHGTWIVVAVALGIFSVGALAVPGGPVHTWIHCNIARITDITSTATKAASCGATSTGPLSTQGVSGDEFFSALTASGAVEPGWTTNGSTGDYDTPWYVDLDGTESASFTFTVAPGPDVDVTYGIPAGGWLNDGARLTMKVNGSSVGAVVGDASYDANMGVNDPLWSYQFAPGTYTLTWTNSGLAGPSGNSYFIVYGVWASNPSQITPD